MRVWELVLLCTRKNSVPYKFKETDIFDVCCNESKKRVILIYSLLSLILVSCAKEDTAKNNGMGTFIMKLNATSEVIGLNENRAQKKLVKVKH